MSRSSELSDALNPNFFNREQQLQVSVSPTYGQYESQPLNTAQPSALQPFTPHSSGLEDTVNYSAVSPRTAARNVLEKQSHQPVTEQLQLVKGLIQSIASYKAAVEQEKKRRLAWEHEQETKHLARQAELENHVAELQRELEFLKSKYGVSQTPELTSPTNDRAQVTGESVMLFDLDDDLPEFVEGSSSSESTPIMSKGPHPGSSNHVTEHELTKSRVQRTTRPQTVQAAMRNHILRCMGLDHDKELPGPHNESIKLPPTQPVRFVWDQTTKKSPHNARMKVRIISDLMVNKSLYSFVPSRDFTMPKLDSVFDQAYTTLRQKYASQNGMKPIAKSRDDIKSRKARRSGRKKYKLANRITARQSLEAYSVSTFDAAFQIDCMSSEESSDGEDEANALESEKPAAGKALRIRCLAWRSFRLQELFRVMDEHGHHSREMKPRRGVGRKDRLLGPPKDGNPPPPKGTPQWMVSKKWLRQANVINPQIATLLTPNNESDAQAASILGEESGDENETTNQQSFPQMPIPHLPMVEALTPISPDAYHQAQYMYAPQAAWTDTMSGYVDMSQFASPLLQQTYAPGAPHLS